MDPILISTVAQLAGSELWKFLVERLSTAKENYKVSVDEKNLDSPLEIRRQELLEKLTSLQASIIISQNNDLITKIVPGLIGQTIVVYEAKTEQDLKLIELSLNRIEGALKLNQASRKRRAIARSLAIFVSLFALGLLGALIHWGALPNGPKADYVIPIIQVPLPILIWSAIGSFAAILYRFNKSGDIELQDPLRWLFTRPLTGIVMGVVTYFVLKIGLLSIESGQTINYGQSEILWLAAFIGGFSDRFSDTVLRALIGRFGGDSDGEILSLENVNSSDSSLRSLISSLSSPGGLIERIKAIQPLQTKDTREEYLAANGDSKLNSHENKSISKDDENNNLKSKGDEPLP